MSNQPNKQNQQSKPDKQEVLVFLFDQMTDYEITLAMHLLATSLDKRIVTVAYEEKPIHARSGAILMPQRLVSDPKNLEAAGLMITGGWHGDFRTELNTLIHALNSQQKLLAGICGAGTFMLAKSGVLEGIDYTTPITSWEEAQRKVFGDSDPFPRSSYKEVPVVRSGNIITSIGPAFIDFSIEICHWFEPFETVQEKKHFSERFK